MSFKAWYYKEDETKHLKNVGDAEQMFEGVVGESVKSLKAFISYLILNKKISGSIRLKNKAKPVSLLSLSDEKKIHYLVKSVKKIKEVVKDYNSKFGNVDKK
jgi:hypothetical protein